MCDAYLEYIVCLCLCWFFFKTSAVKHNVLYCWHAVHNVFINITFPPSGMKSTLNKLFMGDASRFIPERFQELCTSSCCTTRNDDTQVYKSEEIQTTYKPFSMTLSYLQVPRCIFFFMRFSFLACVNTAVSLEYISFLNICLIWSYRTNSEQLQSPTVKYKLCPSQQALCESTFCTIRRLQYSTQTSISSCNICTVCQACWAL